MISDFSHRQVELSHCERPQRMVFVLLQTVFSERAHVASARAIRYIDLCSLSRR